MAPGTMRSSPGSARRRPPRRETPRFANHRAVPAPKAPAVRKMRAVGQLALLSTDPARCADFYEQAFGFKVRASDGDGVDLELGGFELSFRRGERATRDGIQIGFRVETAGDVDAWSQELGQRGFALVGPPSGDRWEGSRSFRLADPDGRQVAIFYDYPR